MELAITGHTKFDFCQCHVSFGKKFTSTLFEFNFLHTISNDFTCFVKIKIFAIKKLVGENHIPGR